MEDLDIVGRVGSVESTVTDQDTARALGSGDVPVLGTPRLIALLEEASCRALADAVSADRTSVGTAVDIVHRRPSAIGDRVVAHARVVDVQGARVTFDVHADHRTPDGEVVESIARGRIVRVIVDRDGFGR
jgi:fluoroacetyl-CoA thioesterase